MSFDIFKKIGKMWGSPLGSWADTKSSNSFSPITPDAEQKKVPLLRVLSVLEKEIEKKGLLSERTKKETTDHLSDEEKASLAYGSLWSQDKPNRGFLIEHLDFNPAAVTFKSAKTLLFGDDQPRDGTFFDGLFGQCTVLDWVLMTDNSSHVVRAVFEKSPPSARMDGNALVTSNKNLDVSLVEYMIEKNPNFLDNVKDLVWKGESPVCQKFQEAIKNVTARASKNELLDTISPLSSLGKKTRSL